MARNETGPQFWLAALRAEGAALRAAASGDGVDMHAAAPSCPGWTVRDVVAHIAGVFSFATTAVRSNDTAAPDDPAPLPAGISDQDLFAAYDEAFRTLVSTLDSADPGGRAWNWAPQPKTVAFWFRRMAHESAIHRWDVQLATVLPEPIETKLAVDGVHEVLDTWLPAGRRQPAADRGPTGLVSLTATDAHHEWYVRLRENGVALLDTDTLVAEQHITRATVAGTASDLQLALYGRIPFDVLETTGDEGLLPALRTG